MLVKLITCKNTTKKKQQTPYPYNNQTAQPISIYKKSNEIKPIDENKKSLVSLDDMLGARNSSQKDELSQEEGMKLWMSITLARAVLVYRDKALEKKVIEKYCLIEH